MKVILKEGEDAEAFIEQIITRVNHRFINTIEELIRGMNSTSDEWISTEEAKKILGVKSKSKIQQLRDESPMNGLIISQHGRTFRYFKPSLYNFLEKHTIK